MSNQRTLQIEEERDEMAFKLQDLRRRAAEAPKKAHEAEVTFLRSGVKYCGFAQNQVEQDTLRRLASDQEFLQESAPQRSSALSSKSVSSSLVAAVESSAIPEDVPKTPLHARKRRSAAPVATTIVALGEPARSADGAMGNPSSRSSKANAPGRFVSLERTSDSQISVDLMSLETSRAQRAVTRKRLSRSKSGGSMLEQLPSPPRA